MISRGRLRFLLQIALPIAAAIILFFSDIFPLENLFTVPPQSLTASIAASDVASLTNEERIKNGLPPLAVSPLLTEAAQLKAEDMARNDYYAHVGPDGKTPLSWLQEVGYSYLNAGENLVIDRTTSEQAVDAWMNSPDHRENILRPQFTEIGIGVAKGKYDGIDTIFVVQEFGTPYPARAVAVAPTPAPKPTAMPAPATAKPAVAFASAASTTVPAAPAVAAVPVLTVPKIASLIPVASTTPEKLAETAAPDTANAPKPAESTSTPAGQGSSTVNYALAPEFYAPVTLPLPAQAQDEAQPAAPQGSSATALSVLVGKIRSYLGHIFHISS